MENIYECQSETTTPENNQKNEIKITPDSAPTNDNKLNINKNINSSSIIDSIFNCDKTKNSQITYPKINAENFNKILNIFNQGVIPSFENKEKLFEFVKDKLKVIRKLYKIIQNRYEILEIIIKFCEKNNFSIIEFYIDLYLKVLEALHSENPVEDILNNNLLRNEHVSKLTDAINWIISCGFINKKDYDYIFRKIAALQLSKKLNNFTFCEYLNLLEIFYGNKYDNKFKEQLIGKHYIYFCNRKNSGIITNISDKNYIESKDGISIIFWLYLTYESNENGEEAVLVEMKINDKFLVKIILDNKNFIIIKSDEKLLKTFDKNSFNIPPLKWVQLKIEITGRHIKLNLYKEKLNALNDNIIDSGNKIQKNNKYEVKSYILENLSQNKTNLTIKSLNFFKNYVGLVGTIIVCNKNLIHETAIKSEYGLENNKIYRFLEQNVIFENYFIISPQFFINDRNMFIDSTNNISGKINNAQDSLAEFNGVFIYKNVLTNIYSVGGIDNLLPLFEILYKFSKRIYTKNDEAFIHFMFKQLIKILELILINKKNYIAALGINNANQTNYFIQSLQLFLEMIDEKFYQKDNEILLSLLKIGKCVYINCFKQIQFEKCHYFYYYILFSPSIILKFSLSQQDMLWKFFDQGKEQKFKIKLSDFKKCFMSFEQMNKFFILLSDKYNRETKEVSLLSNSLKKIIKVILEDKSTKGSEREMLFLLCNYEKLNENIIRGIIEIFNNYLEQKEKSKKLQSEQEKNDANYYIIQRREFVSCILNPNNNNIEILLKLLCSNGRATKKEIINFIQILILKYGDIMENYFLTIEQPSSKGKILKKMNKEEFYVFLEESISFNYYFRKIKLQSSGNKLKQNLTNNNQNIILNNIIDSFNTEEKEKKNKNNQNIKNKNIKNLNMDFITEKKLFNINNESDRQNLIKSQIKSFSMKNKDIHKIRKNIKIIMDNEQLINKENINRDNINLVNKEEILIYEFNIKDEGVSVIEKDSKHLFKSIEVNINLCKILFDLLLNYRSSNKNSAIQDNSIMSFFDKSPKNRINMNKTKSFEEEAILNIYVKFLENIRELEVIDLSLLLILNNKSQIDIYEYLLDYFIFTNTDFLQLIEEILINSYLCLNDNDYKDEIIFVLFKDNSKNSFKENDFFNMIIMRAKELLLDIYFYKNNNNKNKILNGIINLILLISNSNKKCDLNLNLEVNLLYKFSLELYEKILENINDQFLREINSIKEKDNEKSFKSKNSNNIDNNQDSLYFSSIKTYFEFIPFLFEYYLFKNHNIFRVENYKNYVMQINAGFPQFFNLKNIGNFSIYYKFAKTISDLFNINKSLEFWAKSNRKSKNNFDENSDIFIFDKNFISKVFNDYIQNKEYKAEIKFKLELLLMKNNNKQKTYFFTIVEILTIFNNYYIEKYLSENEMFKSDNNKKDFNFIFFLNFHQFFIINIILAACKLKDNETYITTLNKSYQEIQEIFYTCLEYNINNIIKNCSSTKYLDFFIIILINIFSVLSKLYDLYGDKFGKINLSKICIKKLLEFYSNKYKPIFDINNLIKCFKKSTLEENLKLFKEHKTSFYDQILQRNPGDINKKPIIDFFDSSKFLEILNIRKTEINDIEILMNKKEDFLDSNNITNFQDLSTKIKNYVEAYEYKMTLNESLMSIKKRNCYRKIKKRLYSWNNSFSNIDVFYKHNKEKLKFKISNFLSKDLSRKLLVPILDFDYYVPKFQSFEYKKKLFQNTADNSEKNQYDELYNIDLKIFDSAPEVMLPKFNSQNFFIEEVCYIKTNHHINGVLFFSKVGSNIIFFISKNPKKDEELKNNPNYDIENKRCFGSIFSGEFSQKEKEINFNFSFGEINFIFIRKYCFRNNSLEIFTKNHRSYYFKFEDNNKRNQFLENIVNKANKSTKNKRQVFKPIKGIDENNKAIYIGYYYESEENRPFSNISNISELWKNNKISTLEYLMWINIYGNRSFQDVSQYPVFPWLLVNHEHEKFEKLITNGNNIRDLQLPMGFISIDEKGKIRQDGYIESYKVMIMDLLNHNLIKIKLKDDDCLDENNSSEKTIENSENKNIEQNKKKRKSENRSHKAIISIIYIDNQNIIPNCDKVTEGKHLKIFDYNLNLDKLYYNPSIDFDMLPYVFGSSYSNAMYVSHYLCRLFPYSFTAIEIQRIGFDCADRLFINLQNAVYSAISEKGDLREIIPDFFYLPELFININRLDLGKKNEDFVEDVKMPSWCLDNPYLFVENYRSLIECGYLNISAWIDLIFGYYQRGKAAQSIGNIFMPLSYDGVINFRLPPEELLRTRAENEYKIRLFEMGVIPTKVFEKKTKIFKNKMNEQITLKTNSELDIEEIFHEVQLETKFKNVIYFNFKKSLLEEIYIMDKTFFENKLVIQENKETMSYSIKEILAKKPFPFSKFIQRNIQYNLIVKQIFQNEIFVIAGTFDGELHFYKNTNKIECNDEKYEYSYDKSCHYFDKSLITALSIDKEENYLIYGTQNGSLVIFNLYYNLYKDLGDKAGDKFIFLYKFFPSHPDFSINYICINSDLNLFADCSYDGYVNIYNLPKCNLVRSIYIEQNDNNHIYNLDYVFLSAQPLASVVVYSNESSNFKSFSINGNELSAKGKKNEQMSLGNMVADVKNNLNGMSSPIMFTDSLFNDYLLYIMNNRIIFLTKFPSMKIVAFINPKFHQEIFLTNLSISNDLKYIYAYDELNNMIYIVHQK